MKPVPIIALTADTRAEMIGECFKAGITRYLSKPIIRETIAKVLSNCLKKNNILSLQSESYSQDGQKDEQYTLNILKNNISPKYLLPVLQTALDEIPKQLSGLDKVIHAEDWDAVKIFVHKLNGSTNFFATERISKLLDYMRDINTENAVDLYNQLRQEYQKVLREIQAYVTELRA